MDRQTLFLKLIIVKLITKLIIVFKNCSGPYATFLTKSSNTYGISKTLSFAFLSFLWLYSKHYYLKHKHLTHKHMKNYQYILVQAKYRKFIKLLQSIFHDKLLFTFCYGYRTREVAKSIAECTHLCCH